MRAPARLGLYGLVLVAVFAVAFVTAGAVVPEETVQSWAEARDEHTGAPDMNAGSHKGRTAVPSSLGLGLAQDGYQLTGVSAPDETGSQGEMSFAVIGPDGRPVTYFDREHDKELHLIVVRADGQHFRHVHPERGDDGTWTIPWQWDAAGFYRFFADFVPGATVEAITLSTSVQVAGVYAPAPPAEQVTTATVDGFEVSLDGNLSVGESSELALTVSREGQPVTTLEPYLGAYGHLVALREGDLAYLHVHPRGAEPQPGRTSGPEVVFEATAPTPGRYLLYLDFQVDGQVHTAALVIDAADASTRQNGGERTENNGRHREGGDHDHGK